MKKLIIRNLKDFFNAGFDNSFQILGDLERKLNSEKEIQNVMIIPYKENGDIIFELVSINYNKQTVYTYHYTNTAS